MSPLHLILVLSVIAVWGFNFVVIKIGLEGIPPIFLCFVRFFLTSIPWVFFIKRPRAPIKMVLSYGLIMFALQFSLLFIGIYAGITAALASILLQLQAFFSILLAIAFLGEKLNMWQGLGALVSFTGIGLVAVNIGGDVTLSGLLLVISAAALWGVGSVIAKKMGKIDMAALVVWGGLVAWPPLLLVSYLVEGPAILFAVQHLSWGGAGAALYIAYLATLFGFGVWNWLLLHHPLSKIAPFTLLVPVIGTASSAFVLGEPLQAWKVMAGILVIAGLCIHLLGPRLTLKRLPEKLPVE